MERISSVDDGSVIHGTITFVIGDYAYTIDIDSFWDCYEVACDFTLFENPYGDYWMLGVLFYKKYHVLFDYEQRKVTFYSKKEMLVYNDIEECIEILKAMLIVISVIISIGVCWLFWGIKRLLI